MRLSLIVAVAENGVIGRDNGLPWRLSGDLKRFKEITMGQPLIMGRKTFESIGRPLPGRTNIVLTRDPRFRPLSVTVVDGFEAAIEAATRAAEETGADEIMVIGGEGIYRLALPRADRIYLTEVHADIEGDAIFPAYKKDEWTEKSRIRRQADAGETADYSFVTLDRKAAPD